DRLMLGRLEDARLSSVTSRIGGRVRDREGVDHVQSAYSQAFRMYGIDVVALPSAEVNDRMNRSAIRSELAGALFDWAMISPDQSLKTKLIDMAVAVTPDPKLKQIFAVLERTDGVEVIDEEADPVEKRRFHEREKKKQQDLKDLAATADVASLP